ncbi:hypothetical protein ABK040_014612 [Willaertia magna]
MGNEPSIPTENIIGYQVVCVSHNSPAEKAGLCPYFDFILTIDDIDVTQEDRQFFLTYIGRSINQPLKMTVFSLKYMKNRSVTLIPTNDWNYHHHTKSNKSNISSTINNNNEPLQQQPLEIQSNQTLNNTTNTTIITEKQQQQTKNSMCLGCSIRYESVKNALNCVWHVISVYEGSPASKASLCSDGTDYILGYDNRLFSEPNELTELLTYYQHSLVVNNVDSLVDSYNNNNAIYLSLFVYNWKMDAFRHVVVNMSEHHLGIDVGNGYLHTIPPPNNLNNTTNKVNNNKMENKIENNELNKESNKKEEVVAVEQKVINNNLSQQQTLIVKKEEKQEDLIDGQTIITENTNNEITNLNNNICKKEEIVFPSSTFSIQIIGNNVKSTNVVNGVDNHVGKEKVQEQCIERQHEMKTADISISAFDPFASTYDDDFCLGDIIKE